MKNAVYTTHFIKGIILCSFLLFCNNSYSQVENSIASNDSRSKELTIKDTMNCHASFPGGYDSLFLYINNTLKYPEEAIKKGKEGKVVFAYTVDAKGKIKNVSIQDDSGLACGELISKLFTGMPEWRPARENGTPIDKRYTMVISFNLKYAPGGKLEADKFTFWKI